MDINAPLISEEEFLFCEEGNRLAHAFLRNSVAAVKLIGTADPEELRADVIQTMDELFLHRESCPDCKEE
jgi:hypothetical protein